MTEYKVGWAYRYSGATTDILTYNQVYYINDVYETMLRISRESTSVMSVVTKSDIDSKFNRASFLDKDQCPAIVMGGEIDRLYAATEPLKTSDGVTELESPDYEALSDRWVQNVNDYYKRKD